MSTALRNAHQHPGGRRPRRAQKPSAETARVHRTRVAPPDRGRSRHPIDADARTDATVRLLSTLAASGGLLLVTYWWVVDGGLHDLADWADGLTSVGRITGLWSAELLLVQVLLMSRLPVLEHAFGRDRLARLHRWVGFVSFDLMLAHLVTVVGGYASARWSLVPSTTWQLLTGYGGMLLAAAGSVCLVLVVATSLRAARRRLRYESWHLLHLYAYLGVGLALPHQLWTGQQFLTRPAATVFWWALWATAAGAVLVWRVGLPLVRGVRHRLRVDSVVLEGPDVASVYLTGRRLDRLPIRAGQFITVRFLDGPGWSRGNPFSLSAAPDGHGLRITAKALGDGSARLAGLRPGTRVLFEGPYGRLSSRARTRRKVLLAGAGVGITPLRSLAEGLDYTPGDVTLLYRFGDHPLFTDELCRLRDGRGLRVYHLPGRRPHPRSLLGPLPARLDDRSALLELLPDLADHDVYLCGPDDWTSGLARLAREAGVPAARIHTESFGW